MTSGSYQWYQRYKPLRRRLEVGYWLVVFALSAIFNSITQIMDGQRRELNFASWEPAVWESTSALAMLLLVPAVIWLTRQFPLEWRDWRRLLLVYLAASVIYCLAHVLIMVGLRQIAYAVAGQPYSFGSWPRELFYEYLKDFRSFLGTVLIIELYRFALSWLVNLDQIATIESLDTGDARIQLHSGRTVPCSRRYRDRLRSRLDVTG